MSKREQQQAKIKSLRGQLKVKNQQDKILLTNGDFYTAYGLAILSLSNPETNKTCLQLAQKIPDGVLLFECFKDLHHQESLWEPTLPLHSLQRLLENWKYYVSNKSELPNDFLVSSFKQITRLTSRYPNFQVRPKTYGAVAIKAKVK